MSRPGAELKIEQSTHNGSIVLTLTGELDLAAAPTIHRALHQSLAEQPSTIICDLTGVEAIDPVCRGVFTAVRSPAPGWPDPAVILCGARPAVAGLLTRLQVPLSRPLYDTLDEALALARARPPPLRDQLGLDPTPGAPRAARAFVRATCQRWELDGHADLTTLLASELVTNAVVHARTPLTLRLELLRHRLTIAVHDQDPRPPRVLPSGDETRCEHGLSLVDWFAKVWGVRQDPDGGKVVWCVLEPGGAARAGQPR